MGLAKEIESYTIAKDELLGLLHPHQQTKYSFNEKSFDIKVYNSGDLFFNPERFDLIAKYIYVSYYINKIDTNWHIKLYKAHLKAFSGNTFKEGDGSKNSFTDYIQQFNMLIESIKNKGFEKSISLLPIDKNQMIIDGSHRLALSYLFNQKIPTVKLKRTFKYNYKLFINQGLKRKYADNIAFTYCMLNKKARIANVFPIGNMPDKQVENILNKYGSIYYKKKIKLNQQGQDYVIKEMYIDEKWIGNLEDDFKNAKDRARTGFEDKDTLRVYVYVPNSLKDAVKAKTEIRTIINKGNFPIHINDTHEETIRLAKTYFNKNSLHLINNKKAVRFHSFFEAFELYKKWLQKCEVNSEDYCIDASSILSVYGLRQGADLDFLCVSGMVDTGIKGIDCHNEHAHYYGKPIDDIVYNPCNHFYFEGYKFISLTMLRTLKKKRNEEKDRQDVELIDSLFRKKRILRIKKALQKTLPVFRQLRRWCSYGWFKANVHRIIPVRSKLWRFLKKIDRVLPFK